MKKKRNSTKGDLWLIAKKKYKLRESHIAMAKALGLNPKKFGSYANHKQQPWKAPLPDYIEELYEKRFKKGVPTAIWALDKKKKKPKPKPLENLQKDSINFEDFNENDLPF
ncbi:MAG: hypothetical protein AB8G86_30255 [Saprospiraceae bacterium]